MATLPIYDRTGREVGSYEVDPELLSAKISKQLLHDAVVMYQANQRQGTQKTKTRSEVAGSSKKLYRQKGTGNARAGTRRSGTRRGGGHIFAKEPRDFGYRMPRKALQAATRMALAARLQDNEVTLIDELKFDAPKTRDMAAILKALKCDGTTLLVSTETYDVNVYRSARNIAGVDVAPATELNAYSLLRPKRLLLTKGALEGLRQRAGKPGAGKRTEDKPARATRSKAATAKGAK